MSELGHPDSARCVKCKGSGVTPCGVETPEAAAAGHFTPELIAFDRAEFRRWWAQIQVGGIEYEIACPDEVSLIAQGWTPPGTTDAK